MYICENKIRLNYDVKKILLHFSIVVPTIQTAYTYL